MVYSKLAMDVVSSARPASSSLRRARQLVTHARKERTQLKAERAVAELTSASLVDMRLLTVSPTASTALQANLVESYLVAFMSALPARTESTRGKWEKPLAPNAAVACSRLTAGPSATRHLCAATE